MRVKICGLTRIKDVELAIDLGADAVGFVMEPSSPRCVASDAQFLEAVSELGPYVVRVSVFGEYWEGAPEFDRLQTWSPLYTSRSGCLPVVRPGPDHKERLTHLADHAKSVTAVVVDSYSATHAGGTGIAVDDAFVDLVKASGPWRVILAGGLTPETVGERVRRHRPYAVDVSSGVESSPGVKDAARLRDFIAAARGG